MPSTLTSLRANDAGLSGPVDLTNLPKTLQELELSGNKLSGECDFSQLPRSLTRLKLDRNPKLTGVWRGQLSGCYVDFTATGITEGNAQP